MYKNETCAKMHRFHMCAFPAFVHLYSMFGNLKDQDSFVNLAVHVVVLLFALRYKFIVDSNNTNSKHVPISKFIEMQTKIVYYTYTLAEVNFSQIFSDSCVIQCLF